MREKELIYKELSYKIVGLLYELYNKIGAGHKEKYYQSGLQVLLEENNISYKRELFCPLKLGDKVIGKYFLDFLIDDKIVLELKSASYFKKQDFEQIFVYLRSNNLKLGILVYFTKSGVRFKRIVNIK